MGGWKGVKDEKRTREVRKEEGSVEEKGESKGQDEGGQREEGNKKGIQQAKLWGGEKERREEAKDKEAKLN